MDNKLWVSTYRVERVTEKEMKYILKFKGLSPKARKELRKFAAYLKSKYKRNDKTDT